MTADIYCAIPWQCDDCEDRWHKATYWLHDGGYSCDAYTDGHHEDCDEGDIPSVEEQAKAWREYHEDCARWGLDPLGEYLHAKPTVSREAEWQALFQLSIVGMVLQCVRRRGRGPWKNPNDVPSEVRDYLDVVQRGRLWVFRADSSEISVDTAKRLWKLAEDDQDVTLQRTRAGAPMQVKFKFRCTETRDRSRKAYAKAVKREARKAISA